jgi:hypothetical protein
LDFGSYFLENNDANPDAVKLPFDEKLSFIKEGVQFLRTLKFMPALVNKIKKANNELLAFEIEWLL